MRRTRVEAVMAPRPITVAPDTPFKEIVTALLDNMITGMPVVDGVGRVVGVVSDADLALKAEHDGAGSSRLFERSRCRRERRRSRGTTAAQLMSTPAITLAPRDTVEDAADALRRHRIRRLPVVDPVSRRLVGIVSRSDLLRMYLRSDEQIRVEILTEILPRTLSVNPGRFIVKVNEGVVTVQGEVERRPLIPAAVNALRRVEGVVAVEQHLTYKENEWVPVVPTFWFWS